MKKIAQSRKVSVPGVCSFKGTTRSELMMNELEMNKLSYSKFGPKDLWPSISNYVLKLSSANNPESVIAYMYFLDSGGGSYPEVNTRNLITLS